MRAAHGATGIPARSKNDFSAMRSWAIATALTGGATTTSRASRCNPCAGGFSNSVVTTASGQRARRGQRHRHTERRGGCRRPLRRGRRGRDRGQRCDSRRGGLRRRRSGRVGHLRASRSSPAGGSATWPRVTSAARSRAPLRPPRRAVGRGRHRGRLQRRVLVGQQGDGEQPAFVAPASPMANVATGNAGWHLDDRQQRVLAVQVSRTAPALRAQAPSSSPPTSREVGRPAGPSDDRPKASIGCRFGEGEHLVGHAVGADNPRALVGDAKPFEDLDRLAHRRPVARRPDHHRHDRPAGTSPAVTDRRHVRGAPSRPTC